MVAMSNVKYMPSNATLPKADTNDLFSKILHEENSQHLQQAIGVAAPAERYRRKRRHRPGSG